MDNPFNPSFGRIPAVYLQRKKLIADVSQGIENLNSSYTISIVYGMRGIGKTVFLTAMDRKISAYPDWIVVNLAMGMKLLPSFINSLYLNADSKLKKSFKSIEGLNFSNLGLSLSTDISKLTYQDILTNMFDEVRKNDVKVLITLDEVKLCQELKDFARCYQLLNRQGYPIALMIAGLSENISELKNENITSFLLRGKRIALSALNLSQVEASYSKVFKESGYQVSKKILEKMALMTMGYSYAFQLLGYLVLKAAKKSKVIDQNTLECIKSEYLLVLKQNVYTKVLSSLSKQDRKFVLAMAQSPKHCVSIKEIHERLNRPSNFVANYRRRLLDDQVIKSTNYGEVAFTLPFFKEYVLRQYRFEQGLE